MNERLNPTVCVADLRKGMGQTLPRHLPGAWLAGGLLVFAGVWLAHLAYCSFVAPMDTIEQLTWSRALAWGYYKHPPLPTWLLWGPVLVLGPQVWLGYAAGAACTLGALTLLWRWLVKVQGSTQALLALLASLCITYYNGRLNYYNHNVVLMLVSTVAALLCWQALATRQLRWWLDLGLVLGLGALTKYQVALAAASVVAFASHQRAWREPVHRKGFVLAALVAVVLLVPHLVWLQAHAWGPVQYALGSSLGADLGWGDRAAKSFWWVVDQVGNRALAAWLFLAAACRPWRAWRSALSTTKPIWHADPVASFLVCWGLLPLALVALMGLVMGADLQLHWGTPFLHFMVPAIMALCPRSLWDQTPLRRTLVCFACVQGLLLIISHANSPRGPQALQNHHWRSVNAPDFARRIEGPARAALQGPIHVVIGPAALAGAVALALHEKPRVLIDGRQDWSPWVPADLVARCGALQVGPVAAFPNEKNVDDAFPTLAWRVIPRDARAAPCQGVRDD